MPVLAHGFDEGGGQVGAGLSDDHAGRRCDAGCLQDIGALSTGRNGLTMVIRASHKTLDLRIPHQAGDAVFSVHHVYRVVRESVVARLLSALIVSPPAPRSSPKSGATTSAVAPLFFLAAGPTSFRLVENDCATAIAEQPNSRPTLFLIEQRRIRRYRGMTHCAVQGCRKRQGTDRLHRVVVTPLRLVIGLCLERSRVCASLS
jgi:hypothetical protein